LALTVTNTPSNAGVLFYGDTAANNVKASDFVSEVTTRAQFDAWLTSAKEKELSVLDVSLMGATPCVHIFPAVLALAKNMVGFASFARLLADGGDEARQLAQELKVVQVSGCRLSLLPPPPPPSSLPHA